MDGDDVSLENFGRQSVGATREQAPQCYQIEKSPAAARLFYFQAFGLGETALTQPQPLLRRLSPLILKRFRVP